jgi:tripartite-type tricarboxylate transporter receptor subunit TctC
MVRKCLSTLFFCIGLITASASQADESAVRNFYATHQMRIVIRSGPGGTYDFYSRLLAQYMSLHIPGHPTIVAENMPGAGGITAANYVGNEAPHDGTILTIVGLGLPLLQAIGAGESLRTDLLKFGWLGSVSNSNQVMVVWGASKAHTLKQAQQQQIDIGVTGIGAPSQQLPSFYNKFLGTKFKLVFGYQTSGDVNLAMQRGEVQGAGSNEWTEYLINVPNWVHDKTIVPVIQTGLQKEPDLPDTPLLLDLAKTPEQRAAFLIMSESISLGRALATSPGVPAERLAALRRAFTETMTDPQFIAAVKRGRGTVRPESSAQVESIVQSLFDAPKALRDLVRVAQEPAS